MSTPERLPLGRSGGVSEGGEGPIAGAAANTSSLRPLQLRPSATVANGGGGHESIAEPELLALIIEMRLNASRGLGSSVGGASNGDSHKKDHAASGSASPAFDTMDLCHKKIEKLPYEMVDVIKDDVVRVQPHLDATELLSRAYQASLPQCPGQSDNNISSGPDAAPSLEILDISRNKIRKLPSEPGRLLELRVLSLSNNRIRRLPAWVTKMKYLRVLKVDSNPISWPPPNIMVAPSVDSRASDAASGASGSSSLSAKKQEDRLMAAWLIKLKTWIDENRHEADSGADTSKAEERQEGSARRQDEEGDSRTQERNATEEKSQEEIRRAEPEAEGPKQEESQTSPGELREETSKERTTSEVASADASPVDRASPVSEREGTERRIDKQPRRYQNQQQSSVSTERRTASPPPPQVNGKEQIPVPRVPSMYSPSVDVKGLKQLDLSDPRRLGQHGRNNSHSVGQPATFEATPASLSSSNTRKSRTLSSKKSLPDLRQNHGIILSERQASFDSRRLPSDDEPDKDSNSDEGIIYDKQVSQQAQRAKRPPITQSSSHEGALHRREPSSIASPANGRKFSLPTSTLPYNADRSGVDHVAALRRAAVTAAVASGGTSMAPLSSASGTSDAAPTSASSSSGGTVEVERNSYFRRLSTLPPSTISKSISPPVLRFVDATRGVLYALSQIHTALRQYVVFATDERMTGQLSRALEIASATMGNLINSLDRFDSVSRTRGGAEPDVVRGVVLACGESVATFRKVVSVLQIQLKTLHSGADVRYTRTLLLLLYGSMAEVAHCWNIMAPLIDEVAPFLNKTNDARLGQLQTPHTTLPSIAEASSPSSPKTARSTVDDTLQQQQQQQRQQPASAPASRPYRRRHAGSFSAHDVAQGATMGVTNEAVPMLPSNVASPVAAAATSSAPPSETEGLSSSRKSRPSALSRLPPQKAVGQWHIEEGSEAGGSRPSTPVRAQVGDLGGPTTPASTAPHQQGAGGYPWSTPSSSTSSVAAAGMSAPAASMRFGGLSRSQHGGSPESGGGGAMSSRRTVSNVSSSLERQPAPTPFTPYAFSDSARPIVDEHLLLLTVRFTSITLSVCSSLSDHLNSVGVGLGSPARDRTGSSTSEQSSSTAVARAPKSPEGTPTLASAATLASPPTGTPARNRSVTPTAGFRSPTTSSAASSSYGESGGVLSRSGSSSNQKKLRQLRELCNTTAELTRRLQMSLNKVQEHILHPPDPENDSVPSTVFASPGYARATAPLSSSPVSSRSAPAAAGAPGWTTYPLLPAQDSERLHKDCSLLLRSVLQLSAMVKSSSVQLANISQGGTFPKALSRGLVGLMQNSRDVTLHLGFLKGGAAPSTTTTPAVGPAQARAKATTAGQPPESH
ncbi:hypothetical protein L7F22_066836 [Adiantum nelumboides]|nr:hypothetical protein [Adiantum nelumboides]